jgi:outer membrane immunogenic protein
MKRFCIAGATLAALIVSPAIAADMPVKAAIYKAPPPIAYSWTGFYVGGNGGYGWGSRTANLNPGDSTAVLAISAVAGGTPPPVAPFDLHGGLVGLQGGYNWQFDRSWLVGIEADYDWARIRGSGTSAFFLNGLPSTFQVNQNITSFGTVRGRVGWLAIPTLLVYGTGGFAYGHVTESQTVAGGATLATAVSGFVCGPGLQCFAANSSRNLNGWTVGTGLEYALWEHCTIKAEYLYVNLGSGDVAGMPAASVAGLAPGTRPSSFTSANSQVDFHVVRAGLNWKF